jgi:hypothetical protein
MSLSRDDQLHRMLVIAQQPFEPRRIVEDEIRALIVRETPGKPKREGVGIERFFARAIAALSAPL